MNLYLKIRNVSNKSTEEQKAFIDRYIHSYCDLPRYGARLQNYIYHSLGSNAKARNFVVAVVDVDQDAKFASIERKIRTHNLHEEFIIFAIL